MWKGWQTRPRNGKQIPEPRGAGICLNFNLFDRLAGDMDAFAAHARGRPASVTRPVIQPWNVREGAAIDPGGYRLVFTVSHQLDLGVDKGLERTSKED